MVLDPAGPEGLLAKSGLRLALDALRVEGEETRLVGGCVRDALLGREVADIDLATTLLPAETMRRAAAAGIKAVPTGFDHGTVTLVVAHERFEATTLREDIETDGRHAIVRFGRDFARDAERRDFTINALSLDVTGRLHDTTGGLDDLAAGRVRFIGEAATRIREDALRILRFFRFHAYYGEGAPDPEGLSAAIAARDALGRLSRERIRAEMLKLLAAPQTRDAITVLSETGLLMRILGGVGDLGRLARTIASETGTPDGTRRLAALAVFTGEDADRLDVRLRLSRAETTRLRTYACAAARLHSTEWIGRPELRRLVAEHGLTATQDAITAIEGEPRPRLDDGARRQLHAFAEGSEPLPVFPLAGADLITAGARAGQRIGYALSVAREAWYEGGCVTGPDMTAHLLAVALTAYNQNGNSGTRE